MRRLGFHVASLAALTIGYLFIEAYPPGPGWLPGPLHTFGLVLFAGAFWARGVATGLRDGREVPAWRQAARWLYARADVHAPPWIGCRPHCLHCCRCPDCVEDRARAARLGIPIKFEG